MPKKSLIFSIGTGAAISLLFLFVHISLRDVFYPFDNDCNMVQIETGIDAIICYLSPEDHSVKTYKTHVNDNYELFEHWRRLSGLPEDVIINYMEIQSGYEEDIYFGNSKAHRYVSISPIIECDLSSQICLYAQSDFDALVATWAQTIRGQWGSELGKLTISVEGEVVYSG